MRSTLYLDHFELEQAPFRQEPDPRFFYQGAGHPEVLKALLKDVQAGKPLIKLTGGEGVGKTLLHLLLSRQLSADTYTIISLDHPVGSFEDLLRVICMAINQGTKDNSTPRKFIEEFRELLQQKREEQQKVLLIIDEAEKIFLASLERLVKMICDTDEAGVLQILLIGRLELDHNLEQLRIYCSNVDIHAGYILEPLDMEQTRQYLQYRLQSAEIPGGKHLTVFSDAAVAAIYQAAMGNISQTNVLAEKGLRKACAEGMFRVEPELIALQPRKKKKQSALFSDISDQVVEKKWWVAAAVLIVLLVLLFIQGGEDGEEVYDTPPEPTIEEIIVDRPVLPRLKKHAPPVDETTNKAAAPAVEHEEVESEEPVGPVKPVETEKPTESAVSSQPVEAKQLPAVEREQGSPPASKSTQPVTVSSAEKEEWAEPGEPVRLHEPVKKVKPAQIEPVIIQADARKKKGPVPAEQKKTTGIEQQTANGASLIFEERMRATSNWLAWSYRGGYTIQLMMLTAEDAEQNLKKILVQEEYAAVRDNMYIVKRNSPPAYFVYYGMYDTFEQARQARNTIPSFLRVHHPYALSIKEALKKTEE